MARNLPFGSKCSDAQSGSTNNILCRWKDYQKKFNQFSSLFSRLEKSIVNWWILYRMIFLTSAHDLQNRLEVVFENDGSLSAKKSYFNFLVLIICEIFLSHLNSVVPSTVVDFRSNQLQLFSNILSIACDVPSPLPISFLFLHFYFFRYARSGLIKW